MSETDNPAGRLHALLVKYEASRSANPGRAMETVWQGVLGKDDLPAELTRAASLVASINDAVRSTGQASLVRLVQHHQREWAAPFVFQPVAAGNAIQGDAGTVSQGAMLALESLSTILSLQHSEGGDLGAEERSSYRDELQDLIDSIREAPDLDNRLKAVILQRLHDIALALDHYDVMGPGALVSACERIVAASALTPGMDAKSKSKLLPVWQFAGRVYTAVAFVGASGDAAEAIQGFTQALGIGDH